MSLKPSKCLQNSQYSHFVNIGSLCLERIGPPDSSWSNSHALEVKTKCHLYTKFCNNKMYLKASKVKLCGCGGTSCTCFCVCLQAVRPHTPLIKFPNRQEAARPNGEFLLIWRNLPSEKHLLFIYLRSYVSFSGSADLQLLFGSCCDAFFSFPFSAQEALKTLAVNFTPQNTAASAASPPQVSKAHVPLTPIPGTPDTLASIQLLTARYRRRLLTPEEMEYIQVRQPSVWPSETKQVK